VLKRQDLDMVGSATGVLVNRAAAGGAAPALWPSLGAYPCYDPFLYDLLTNDHERNKVFRGALRRLVQGKTVLDIGTGQELNWAQESRLSGARHVFAMEAMAESFRRASGKLNELGLHGDITLSHGMSTELTLEHRVNVCVSEVIGSIAGAEGAAVILEDARRRHVVPDGLIVPHRCVTRAAAVSLREVLASNPVAFSPDAVKYLERVFNWNKAPFDIRLRVQEPSTSALLTVGEPVEILDFNGDLRHEQENRVSLTVERDGLVDGLLLWPEITCHPDDPPLDTLRVKTSWDPVYFPVFDTEIPVIGGDVIDLVFQMRVGEDGVHPDYRVQARLRTHRGAEHLGEFASPYRGTDFRGYSLYRQLFPE
jgi:protein arginine N-methyltransferase 1